MRFIQIPAGTFRMGWTDGLYGADDIHEVTVASFWMGQFEVTNAHFKLFKDKNFPPMFAGNTQPATPVTWDEAKQFCQWMSQQDDLDYRLPTEAEWEYAARGGLDQKLYPWGNSYDSRSANSWNQTTTTIGSFAPNGYGLYDMAGNVSEWVNDPFSEDYYKISPKLNPPGPAQTDADWIQKTGTDWRIVRGGWWGVGGLEVGRRSPWALDEKNPVGCGFRVVVSSLSPTKAPQK